MCNGTRSLLQNWSIYIHYKFNSLLQIQLYMQVAPQIRHFACNSLTSFSKVSRFAYMGENVFRYADMIKDKKRKPIFDRAYEGFHTGTVYFVNTHVVSPWLKCVK